MGLRAALVLGAAVLAACGDRTEIVVVTDTDLSVPAELDGVRFVVVGPNGDEKTALADLDGERPVTLGLLHGGGALGPLDVTVVGERSGAEVLRRRARTGFVEGETLMLRMDLLARCTGASCPAEQSCGETGCASVEIDPASLPPWSGNPPPLEPGGDAGPLPDGGPGPSDAGPDAAARDAGRDGSTEPDAGCGGGCDDGVECTVDECVDGACVNTTDATACDDGIPCTTDACDAVTGCSSTGDNRACPAGQLCDTLSGCVLGPTFTDVYAVISAQCSPCHTGGGMFSGDLNMSTQALAHADLVGVTATCGSGNVRVIPYDSRSSLLWRKVAAVDLCGARMPNGRTGLPMAQIDLIRDWIEAGAADN